MYANFFLVGGGGGGGVVNEVHQEKCGSGVCDSKGSLKFRPRKDRRYYIRQIHKTSFEYFVVNEMKLWTGSYIFTTGRQPSVHAAAVVIESVLLKFLLGSSCLFKSLAPLILLSWLVHLVKSLPLHTLEPKKGTPFGQSLLI